MSYTLFAGCSLTAGSGFELGAQDPDLWCNQLHQELFGHTQLLNVAKGGQCNANIFKDVVNAVTLYPVEQAIVQWTSMPRYELELGFELYNTHQSFVPSGQCRDHNLNDINYSGQYLNKIKDRFTALAHDQYEIVQLITYANCIQRVCQLTNTKLYFVNGLCPWDAKFFDQLETEMPSQYTVYTQKLLNTDQRDDQEVFQLYKKMHNQYTMAGGVQHLPWLNLYDSMHQHKIDTNSDSKHPGVKSNALYANMFANAILKTSNYQDVLAHIY
jgi:hypothetical protein